MRTIFTSRHDPGWHPGLGYTASIQEAFSSPLVYRQRSGVSRNGRDWRPGLGELSTAELAAQKVGLHFTRRSLGQQGPPTPGEQQVQQISTFVSTGIDQTVGILVALGTITGPVGAVIAGVVAVGALLVSVFRGCGETCVEATDIVNQVEPILDQNLQTYLSSPIRTVSMQAAALNNFNVAWAAVVQNCNNPQLLSAGQNCIKDRQQGSCAYKTSPGGWTRNSDGTCTYTGPGANGSGTACWNWFVGYHDPIANDPCVVPDSVVTSPASTTTAATGPTATTTATTTPPGVAPLLLIGGIVLAAILLL